MDCAYAFSHRVIVRDVQSQKPPAKTTNSDSYDRAVAHAGKGAQSQVVLVVPASADMCVCVQLAVRSRSIGSRRGR